MATLVVKITAATIGWDGLIVKITWITNQVVMNLCYILILRAVIEVSRTAAC